MTNRDEQVKLGGPRRDRASATIQHAERSSSTQQLPRKSLPADAVPPYFAVIFSQSQILVWAVQRILRDVGFAGEIQHSSIGDGAINAPWRSSVLTCIEVNNEVRELPRMLDMISRTRDSTHVVLVLTQQNERTITVLREKRIGTFIDATTATSESFALSIKTALLGERCGQQALDKLYFSLPRPLTCHLLSPREEAIMAVIGSGVDNGTASATLKISADTVRSHRCNIMRKLGLHHKGDLVAYAMRKGYVGANSFGGADSLSLRTCSATTLS